MKKLAATLAVLPVLALTGHASAALPIQVHVGETVTFQATPCSPACAVLWTVSRYDANLHRTYVLYTSNRPSMVWTFDTSTVTVQEKETRGNGTNGIVEQLQTTYVPVP